MFGLERLFGSRKPRARSVADRLGGGPERPVEVRPWTPSERPPELPWEREETADPNQPAPQRSHRSGEDLADTDASSADIVRTDEFLGRRFG